MEILGYFFALIIGLVTGLIGAGGSIISVPVFVYLFRMDSITATTLSLIVVAITSIVGTAGYYRMNYVRTKTALLFGIPSIIAVIISRQIILPALPENIWSLGSFIITKDAFILVLFAILMLISSYKMIWKKQKEEATIVNSNYSLLIFQGLFVGLITGLIGAGGGFLIIPALVMLVGLNMKEAIGTSLMIISMNSLVGFFSSPNFLEVDWKLLGIFSILSIIGMFVGIQLSKKTDGKKLKPIFGWFVMILGTYIIVKELLIK